MSQVLPMTLSRKPPENLESEQAVLGALMVNNAAFDHLPPNFEPRHFSEEFHAIIMDIMLVMRKSGKLVNPITVKTMVSPEQASKMVGELTVAQYLARLASNAVSIVNAPDYAGTIIEEWFRRQLIRIGEGFIATAHECDGANLMEETEGLKSGLEATVASVSDSGGKTMASAAETALDATNEAYSGRSPAGVDYGFSPLMSMIGPALPGQLIIIGGATKQGKSSLIEQIIAGAAINGHFAWVYSGEMNGEQLAQRALSRLTSIEVWRQAQGKIKEAEYEKLENARKTVEAWMRRIHIIDQPMTLAGIERSFKAFAKSHKSCLGVVDHIGLVERDKSNNRMSDAEFGPMVTRTLKQVASKAKAPIFAAAQLKKNVLSTENGKMTKATFEQAISRRPRYADLFGACEKDANHVVIPFRAEPILQELEPAEGTDLYPVWESLMEKVTNGAEIILALSRETKAPQRRYVGWDGKKTMFLDTQEKEMFQR